MLVIMLIFLAHSLIKLSKEGAIEYCVSDNSSGFNNITCYKERWIAQNHADAINRDKNLDYKYINNYSNITLWDINLSQDKKQWKFQTQLAKLKNL